MIKNKATQQVLRFAAVGVISTLLDILIFNVAIRLLGLSPLVANIISTSIATVFNYFAHERWTFKTEEDEERERHLLAYIIVTVSSLYIIQNVVLYFVKDVWRWPANFAGSILKYAHIISTVDNYWILNLAKLYALCVGAAWSFILYRKFVFIKNKKLPSEE